jgi:hypothetical protein
MVREEPGAPDLPVRELAKDWNWKRFDGYWDGKAISDLLGDVEGVGPVAELMLLKSE